MLITALFALAAAMSAIPIDNLLLSRQPQHEYFGFNVTVGGNPDLPNVSGAIDTYFDIATNPAGVSAGNPVTMTVNALFPFDISKGNVSLVLFQVGKGFRPNSVSEPGIPSPAMFELRPISTSSLAWTGSAKIVYFTPGVAGGFITFFPKNGSSVTTVIPDVIQIQPASVTQQYNNEQVLVSLEYVIIALFLLDIAITHKSED